MKRLFLSLAAAALLAGCATPESTLVVKAYHDGWKTGYLRGVKAGIVTNGAIGEGTEKKAAYQKAIDQANADLPVDYVGWVEGKPRFPRNE